MMDVGVGKVKTSKNPKEAPFSMTPSNGVPGFTACDSAIGGFLLVKGVKWIPIEYANSV